jgi:xanthine/uracil permease
MYDSYFVAVSASVGLSFLQFTNMNSMRNLFIVGVSLFLGLSIPEYFREYTIRTLHGPAHTKAGWVSFLFINQSYEYDHKKYLTLFITTSF